MYDIIEVQVVALVILAIIFGEYISYRKLPLVSTKCFTGILVFAGINLALDFITCFTIVNLNTVPEIVNRILNVLYHLSFIGVMAMLFYYVDFFGKEQKRESIGMYISKTLPAALGGLVVLFSDISYYYDGTKLYTYGMAVNLCALICAIYVLMIYICLFTKKFETGKRIRISLGVGIWVILMIIQLYTHVLLSTIASVALILIIFTAMENPKLYIDDLTNCFNEKALKLMIDEIKQFDKRCYFIQLHVDNYDNLSARLGSRVLNWIFLQMTHFNNKDDNMKVFRRSADSFVVLVNNDGTKVDFIVEKISEHISKYNSVLIRYHMDVVNSSAIETYKDLESILDYQNYTYSYMDKSMYRYVDSTIRLAVERKDQIVSLLKEAIDSDGFEVYYQPIYNVKTKTYTSAEALVRLKDTSTIGYVSPQEFIPLAEREGLIGELGNVVFSQVCHFLSTTKVRQLNLDYMDVNLSAIQCTNPNLYNEIFDMIKINNIDPSSINFEITESAVLEGGNQLTQIMDELRRIGCRFSMDDFGTGYSNMSNLGKNDYQTVKIDKSLVWPCFSNNESDSKKARIVLKSVVELILNLGIDIVAEGVENQEQLDMLKELGVNKMQGYFFAKPMIGRDFIQFLNKQDSAIKKQK